MDAFKEQTIGAAGDRFVRRGFACLVLDGPGQGTSLLREIWYQPEHYGEVGTAAIDWLLGRKDIDPKRIMAWGLSFGSFWATQMAAAEPRFAACAVMYTCFQPHNWPLYEMASPSFKQRFMYMTGVGQEEAFGAVIETMDVRPLSPKIHTPYFVIAGEDDSLSDISCTIEHLNAIPGPKTLCCMPARNMAWGLPFLSIRTAVLHHHRGLVSQSRGGETVRILIQCCRPDRTDAPESLERQTGVSVRSASRRAATVCGRAAGRGVLTESARQHCRPSATGRSSRKVLEVEAAQPKTHLKYRKCLVCVTP